jgi:hypothetical protein
MDPNYDPLTFTAMAVWRADIPTLPPAASFPPATALELPTQLN